MPTPVPKPRYALAALLTCLTILPSMQPSAQPRAFDLQGHRGCRGLMPENTIPAMLRALELGVTTLEMDVVISRDDVVVVSHDPYMNADFCLRPDSRAIEPREERELLLYGMDYADIARWDVGSKPHPKFPAQRKLPAHKPRLADLIDSAEAFARRTGRPLPHYNIETKSRPAGDGRLHPEPKAFVMHLMGVLMRKNISHRVTVQSFDIRTLQAMHLMHPSVRTSLLVEATDRMGLSGRLAELGFTPSVYSPAWQLVTPALVKDCHDRGMAIVPWTVNEAAEMLRLRDMGVDGLITDYPDRFPTRE
jgi:glycerophosphoryl diester phosphodiesterase